MYSATYSPDDNKLRLSAAGRLPPDLYARVRAEGFRWAPKQDIFVSPRWTPAAEDLLLELCGDIGDDDASLTERAEERAARFDGYSESRADDAEQARAAVARIADHIPLGQPILIGHHSEKHARRDAEKIDNGMRRAVKMWKTSKYWQERAAGAIRHAKYKERPDVRARRIKGIEADRRKIERTKAEAEKFLRTYGDAEAQAVTLGDGRGLIAALLGTYEGGLSFEDQNAFTKGTMTREDAQAKAMRNLSGTVAACNRWIDHYDNRLAYERAMLADAGGTVADRTAPEKGGACRCWTFRAGWSLIQKVNKVSVTVLDNWGNGGPDFLRNIAFDKLAAVMSRAQVDEARAAGRVVGETPRCFVLLDATPPNPPEPPRIPAHPPELPGREPTPPGRPPIHPAYPPTIPNAPAPGALPETAAPGFDFERMRDSLRAGGVKVVSVPQLFPTPAPLAARMVELADIRPAHTVLEPNGGTGQLVRAIIAQVDPAEMLLAVVEINPALTETLAAIHRNVIVKCADFLECDEESGTYDRIVMNPPFQNGDDIRHIEHAYSLLRPGGRLVALCANGPRQRAKLQPLALEWEDLPPGTFKDAGTGVNTALLVMERP